MCMVKAHNGHRLADATDISRGVIKDLAKVKVKIDAAKIVNRNHVKIIKDLQK